MTDEIIDETRMAEDLGYRLDHLKEFMGITERDGEVVRETLGKLAEHAESIVDAVYGHLFRWSSTAKYFLDEKGIIRDAFLRKRKETLTHWIATVGKGETDVDFAAYMVSVGRQHAATTGEVALEVPHHYLIALMSVVQSTISDLLAKEIEDKEKLRAAIVSWNKLLMLALELMLTGQGQADGSLDKGR